MALDDQTIAVYDEQALAYSKLIKSATEDQTLIRFMERLPDASSAMIEMCRQFEGVKAVQATFDDLSDTEIYDGIWANFSLLHAARADFPRHLSQVARALKPGGLFHIGMKTGAAESRDSIGRHYAYYSEEELRALLDGVGLIVDEKTTGESLGLAGDVEPWVVYLAVRT